MMQKYVQQAAYTRIVLKKEKAKKELEKNLTEAQKNALAAAIKNL